MTSLLVPWALIVAFLFITATNGQTRFFVDLSTDRVLYDDTLTVTLTIAPSEEITNPSLELRIPDKVTFRKALIRCTLCQDRSICQSHEETLDDPQGEALSQAPRFTFENRVIDDAQVIPVAENVSSWPSESSMRSTIRFDGVRSTDIDTSRYYVIGILRYQKTTSGDDEGQTAVDVEHVFGKYVVITPVDVRLFLDGNPPGQINDTRSIIHVIDVRADFDAGIGDCLLKLPLSTDLTILRAEYTLGSESMTSVIDLPIPKDNELAVFLPEFTFTQLAEQWCTGSRCPLHLIAQVATESRLATNGGDGATSESKEISVKASVFYGSNLQSLMDSETLVVMVHRDDKVNGSEVATSATVGVVETSTMMGTSQASSVASSKPSDASSPSAISSTSKDPTSPTPSSGTQSTTGMAGVEILEDLRETGPIQTGSPPTSPSTLQNRQDTSGSTASTGKSTIETSPSINAGSPSEAIAIPDDAQSLEMTNGDSLTSGSCRDGWFTLENQMNDRCYTFPNRKLSFYEAEAYCRDQLGAHLPSFHSPNGLLTLSTFWKNHAPTITDLWLGLSKSTYDEPWKWTDGSAFDFHNRCDTDEAYWANCTIISVSTGHDYCWLNRGCNQEYYFVCSEQVKRNTFWWW